MKCPYCDGKGTVLKIIYEDWKKDEIVRSAVKCPRCNGSGEVQTNEEYLRSLNTEQLAEWIFNDRVEQSEWWYPQCGHTVGEVFDWLNEESET